MTSLSPNRDFDIFGTSYGAILALKLIRKSGVSRAVIIDVMSGTPLEEGSITDDYILGFVLRLFAQNMPKNLMERISRDLNCVHTIDQKINKLSAELKEFGGKNLVTKDLDQIVRDWFNRAKMFAQYRLKMSKVNKLKTTMGEKLLSKCGKLLVIKPLEDLNQINVNHIKDELFLSNG